MERDSIDPKGLIREAYRIDGIGASECRSIFLDWALGVPVGEDARARIPTLLERYGGDFPDHPMTRVLQEGAQPSERPRRRGGWKSRNRDQS